MDNPITVNKNELIDKLRTNLKTHQTRVDLAQEAYRKKVSLELERRLMDARRGNPIDLAVLARMPVPRSYAEEYEQAIAELQWHTQDEIELSSRDFRRYVLDKWEWQEAFAGTTQVYLAE